MVPAGDVAIGIRGIARRKNNIIEVIVNLLFDKKKRENIINALKENKGINNLAD
jgi:hypothetical protein